MAKIYCFASSIFFPIRLFKSFYFSIFYNTFLCFLHPVSKTFNGNNSFLSSLPNTEMKSQWKNTDLYPLMSVKMALLFLNLYAFSTKGNLKKGFDILRHVPTSFTFSKIYDSIPSKTRKLYSQGISVLERIPFRKMCVSFTGSPYRHMKNYK